MSTARRVQQVFYFLFVVVLHILLVKAQPNTEDTSPTTLIIPPLAQRYALLDLYRSTNGPWWRASCKYGWEEENKTLLNLSKNFCKYPNNNDLHGVHCHSNDYQSDVHVTHLDFTITVGWETKAGCNLTGTIPSSFSAAFSSSLEYLSLSDNRIGGTLDASWGNFSRLAYIYFRNNRLQGTLPAQWYHMSRLGYLGLGSNQIVGTLPPEWKNFRNIFTIDVSDNRLHGTLPKEWSACAKLSWFIASNNTLSGTLPSAWSNVSTLSNIILYLNNLRGVVPASWAEKLKEISNSQKKSCNGISCAGEMPPNARCSGIVWGGCMSVQLFYNCIDTRPEKIPRSSPQNAWNWSNVFFGQQRSNCPVTETASTSVTRFFNKTESSAVSVSETSLAATPTLSTSSSSTLFTRSLSTTLSTTNELGSQQAPLWNSKLTPADSVSTLLISAVSGVTMGVSSASNAQRALLSLRLLQCSQLLTKDTKQISLSFSESLLQLNVAACQNDIGGESQENRLSLYCGAVLGNLILFVSIIILVVLFGFAQSVRQSDSVQSILGEKGLPGRAVPVLIFFIQPTVTFSLHLWWYGGVGSPVTYLIGSCGVAMIAAFCVFACQMFIGPKSALHFLCAKIQHPPTPLQKNENKIDIHSNQSNTNTTQCVRYYAAWLLDPLVVWEPVQGLPKGSQQHTHARHFVAMWGSLFTKYHLQYPWYFVVSLTDTILSGVIASVEPGSDLGCDIQRWALLALSVAGFAALIFLRPFASPVKQSITAIQEATAVATTIFLLIPVTLAVEVLARIQLCFGCVGIVMLLARSIIDRLFPDTQSQLKGGAPTNNNNNVALLLGKYREHWHGKLNFFLLHAAQVRPQRCEEALERLRELITLIARSRLGLSSTVCATEDRVAFVDI